MFIIYNSLRQPFRYRVRRFEDVATYRRVSIHSRLVMPSVCSVTSVIIDVCKL